MSSQLHNMKQMSNSCTHKNTSNECMRDGKEKKYARESERNFDTKFAKTFSRSKTSPIKSGKTWQQLTSKVSYLCLACAKDGKTNAEKTAAEQKMAGVSDRSQDEKTENGNLKTAAEMEMAAVSDRSKIATCYAVSCYDVASPPVANEHSLFASNVKVQVLLNS